jgi:hypothetical protein
VHGKTDPDKRDYIVSSQKLYNLGFKPKRDLEHGIREIMEFSAIIPDLENSSYHLKNY